LVVGAGRDIAAVAHLRERLESSDVEFRNDGIALPIGQKTPADRRTSGIGAPSGVPTPSIEIGKFGDASMDDVYDASTPSVTSSIRPCATGAAQQRFGEFQCRARCCRAPASSLIERRQQIPMVRTSSVSGATVWASPAYATMPV
jgi:hypothetical protein